MKPSLTLWLAAASLVISLLALACSIFAWRNSTTAAGERREIFNTERPREQPRRPDERGNQTPAVLDPLAR